MPPVTTLATIMEPTSTWLPVVILIVIGLLFAAATLVASILVGPRHTDVVKESIYESGMAPVTDTHRRFNARFYVVAMIFVVFDVEIVFFYPWATLFPAATGAMKSLLMVEMLVFVTILLVAYIYAWGKGVFRWD